MNIPLNFIINDKCHAITTDDLWINITYHNASVS
jgi:hypothetical protein